MPARDPGQRREPRARHAEVARELFAGDGPRWQVAAAAEDGARRHCRPLGARPGSKPAAANDPGERGGSRAARWLLAPPSCGVALATLRRSSLRLPLSLPGSFASLRHATRVGAYAPAFGRMTSRVLSRWRCRKPATGSRSDTRVVNSGGKAGATDVSFRTCGSMTRPCTTKVPSWRLSS